MSILNYENMTKKQIIEELLALQGAHSRTVEGWQAVIGENKRLSCEGAALRKALEGLHFHHKAFEPLCGKCQAAVSEGLKHVTTGDVRKDLECSHLRTYEDTAGTVCKDCGHRWLP